MHAKKIILILVLFFASSDARDWNATNKIKSAVFADTSTIEKLNKLGLTSFAAVEDDPDAVLTTWDDLKAVGITTNVLRDGYRRLLGVRPNNQHLNDAFTRKNGWYSYNRRGPMKILNVKEHPQSSISNHRILTNDDDEEMTHTVTLTTSVSDTVVSTVTDTSQISTSATVSADIGKLVDLEFSTSFSFTNAIGSQTTHSSVFTVGDQVEVKVPPHSKVNVSLIVSWISKTADWEIPITIDPMGLTGVDFHRRVNGHFFWGAYHTSIANPPFMSKIRGRLDASYGTTGSVVTTKL